MADTDNLPTPNTDAPETPPVEGSEGSIEKKDDGVKKEVFNPFEENTNSGEDTDKTLDVEIDDDDRKTMSAVIKNESKGIVSKVEGLEVDMKVNTFLSDEKNKVYRPFQEKIREYAKSPASKNLTAEAIARLAVDPREMMAKGAEAERKASKESRDSVSAGSTARTPEGSNKVPDAWSLAPEKFKQAIEKAKRGR